MLCCVFGALFTGIGGFIVIGFLAFAAFGIVGRELQETDG
jgi:hypothetical protein